MSGERAGYYVVARESTHGGTCGQTLANMNCAAGQVVRCVFSIGGACKRRESALDDVSVNAEKFVHGLSA